MRFDIIKLKLRFICFCTRLFIYLRCGTLNVVPHIKNMSYEQLHYPAPLRQDKYRAVRY